MLGDTTSQRSEVYAAALRSPIEPPGFPSERPGIQPGALPDGLRQTMLRSPDSKRQTIGFHHGCRTGTNARDLFSKADCVLSRYRHPANGYPISTQHRLLWRTQSMTISPNHEIYEDSDLIVFWQLALSWPRPHMTLSRQAAYCHQCRLRQHRCTY